MVMQGRELNSADLGLIRGLLDEHPEWCRSQLSVELCHRWDWRNAQGRIKDMAARTLLLKLERAGHILLPPRRRPSPNGKRNRLVPVVDHATGSISGTLRDLQPLSVSIVAPGQVKYGHPVQALETFVDRDRFKGTCYRAANWLRLGETRGRTRNDRGHYIKAAVKDVYLYPLVTNFRRGLCSPACSQTERSAGD